MEIKTKIQHQFLKTDLKISSGYPQVSAMTQVRIQDGLIYPS